MKKIAIMAISLAFVGCAVTYKPPVTTSAGLISGTFQAEKSELIAATQKTLAIRGDQISNMNESLGIISTQQRTLKLTPEMADCGTTMGIDYLKDNRTSSKVHFNIIVENNKIQVKSVPTAEYKVGAVDQDMNLTCVSKGVLERSLLSDIRQSLYPN